MQVKLKCIEDHERKLDARKDQFLVDVRQKVAAREAEIRNQSAQLDAKNQEWEEAHKSSEVHYNRLVLKGCNALLA